MSTSSDALLGKLERGLNILRKAGKPLPTAEQLEALKLPPWQVHGLLNGKTARSMADWDENKHPRDAHGHFTTSGEPHEKVSRDPNVPGNNGRELTGDPSKWAYDPEMDTLSQFKVNGKWVAGRQELHDRIIKHFDEKIAAAKDSEHLTVHMLGGGPASGKGELRKQTTPDEHHAVYVNPDDIKEMLPEYNRGIAAGNPVVSAIVHEESSELGKTIANRVLANGKDMVLDTTGDGTIEKLAARIDSMRSAGAKTIDASYATVPIEMAQARAIQREKQFGRQVKPEVVEGIHRAVSQTFERAIQKGLFDHAKLYDTTVALGVKAPLIMAARGNRVKILNPAGWQAFLDKGR